MKLAMIATLYAIGMMVYTMWKIGSKRSFKEFIDDVKEIDAYNLLPEHIAISVVVVGVIIASTYWPIETVRFPYKRLKKSKKSS